VHPLSATPIGQSGSLCGLKLIRQDDVISSHPAGSSLSRSPAANASRWALASELKRNLQYETDEVYMIPYQDMPENNREIAKLEVSFPNLESNTPASCPVQVSEILEYLNDEAPSDDSISEKDLKFIRTAQVAESEYWIWEFQDSEGTKYYVTVSRSPQGSTEISYDENFYSLTPKQFILGTYHNVF
jgi:hypothetical protein